MSQGGGRSGWMYVLRGTADRAERGERHDGGASLFTPEQHATTRRRVLVAWLMCAAWLPGLVSAVLGLLGVLLGLAGSVLAIGVVVDPRAVGSPARRWAKPAPLFAALGVIVFIAVWG
ncbi:MAG: hypothetical protein AAFZ07_26835 [Actinomycetota bacterium]